MVNRVSALMKKKMSVMDNSSMQHGIWAKSGAERCFLFTGKPGINVYLEDPSNPEIF
jgi:hypothetical protein